MSYFAIRVAYLYNEEESEFIIYAVHFYETIEGVNSEIWHMETLPYGVTGDSIQEIKICEGTPGYMLISLITALFIVLIAKSYYKKRYYENIITSSSFLNKYQNIYLTLILILILQIQIISLKL